MNLLDENIPQEQLDLLQLWGFRCRAVGRDLAALSIGDDNLVPLLHRLKQPTLFTRDRTSSVAAYVTPATHWCIWISHRRSRRCLSGAFCATRISVRKPDAWGSSPVCTTTPSTTGSGTRSCSAGWRGLRPGWAPNGRFILRDVLRSNPARLLADTQEPGTIPPAWSQPRHRLDNENQHRGTHRRHSAAPPLRGIGLLGRDRLRLLLPLARQKLGRAGMRRSGLICRARLSLWRGFPCARLNRHRLPVHRWLELSPSPVNARRFHRQPPSERARYRNPQLRSRSPDANPWGLRWTRRGGRPTR